MYAVIRVRGLKHLRPAARAALQTLQLDRKNHCVLVNETKEMSAILKNVQDYVAYGSVKNETIAALLKKRGKRAGDQPLDAAFLKKHDVKDFTTLAAHLAEGKTTLQKLEVKTVFRLNSPRKGFPRIGIKQSAELKGPLGFHENGLDALVKKMM